MKSVGKQLQDARLARNWTPELAARETKIKVDRLRDLEADDYTHFSSPTYARGFVRTYARALGLDEYKILRQLDTKLPEDETSSFSADAGIPYVPEPSKAARASGSNAGLYVVLSLGMGVFLVIAVILFEAYRAGVLPGYFADNSSTDQTAAPATNEAPATADSETPAARAKPVDPNAPPPPITADGGNATVAPKALPVNVNSATTDPNAPIQSVRALPVDPSQLTNATPPMASGLPPATTADGGGAPTTPPRALPVDPSELATANLPAANMPTAGVTNATPNDPAAQAPAPLIPSASARQANSGPVRMPPVPAPAPAPVPALSPAPALPPTAVAGTTNDAPPAAPETDNAAEKRLVLTASHDSFVRVTSEDGDDAEKVLYASVLHTGQSVGFDGRKFSINVGVPSAVDITLDGVNYGPHSDQEAPETFTLESRQP